MCAINPTHKKRFILDVYTADPNMTNEKFIEFAVNSALSIEQELNSTTRLRWHIKESKEEAD